MTAPLTNDEISGIVREEIDKLTETLEEKGIDVKEVIGLFAFDTPEGIGMVSASSKEAPQSLRRLMLIKALERK